MYQVSEDYIEQMLKRGTRRRLTGSIGSVSFSGADVVLGSFSVSGRATEESETKIGGVFLGELAMTFVPSFLTKVPRGSYEGAEVSVAIGLLVDDEWVDIPVGVYTLDAPKISKQGIAVSGYDNMQKLDKKFNIDETSATIYAYLSYMAESCGVELGQTQEEISALPNGTEVLGIYEESDIETFRDLLYWLAQTAGCFACADREGKIVLRKFGNPTDIEIDEEHRDNDVVFSDYITKWTGVSYVDLNSQTTKYYGLEVDDGLTMNLGSNPLLQLGTADAIERRVRNILNAVAEIQYTPYYFNSARDCIFDLGDEIPFTGGISGNSTGVVMAYTYELDSYSFEGYGDNPTLANARSKMDKNISGLIQSTVENEVTYYNYTNVEAIHIVPEEETLIASLSFTSAQKTTVKILHEFIFDILADASIGGAYELKYYLDDQEVTYAPYERIGGITESEEEQPVELSIARDFFYILKDVEPNVRHTWKVNVIAHGITDAVIDVEHAHVTLEGQRLYGEEYFDGFVEALDEFTVSAIGGIGVVAISDTPNIILSNAVALNIDDNFTILDVSGIAPKTIVEGVGELAPHIFLEGGISIESESELLLTTEDDNQIITD